MTGLPPQIPMLRNNVEMALNVAKNPVKLGAMGILAISRLCATMNLESVITYEGT
jgi:hypothetical protein